MVTTNDFGTVLIVDDDQDAASLLSDGLRQRGFTVDAVASASLALEHLQSHAVDVVVTDVHMEHMSGIELCRKLRDHHPDLLAIVITGQGDLPTAVSAMHAGAYDFITKPVQLEVLALAVRRAIDHLALQHEVTRLRSAADRDLPIPGITGSSPALCEVIRMIRRVAASDATVLVTGESGTGKELVARALHDMSPRRDLPFVVVNCGAIPAPLLESELFGHVRGAFTDAKQGRGGLFVQAGAGTIFLDELGEMPLEMQVKLLRVLQERQLRPVGSDEELPFKARVVAATNHDLDAEVAAKRFREDLYYRVNVVEIRVPPLRARRGDILILIDYFLERIARRTSQPVRRMSRLAARALIDYNWPGNVRELENCMERAVAVCRHDEIVIEDLTKRIQDHLPEILTTVAEPAREMLTLSEVARRYVRQVLSKVRDNKTHAARELGIDRRSLYRRLEVPRDLDDRPPTLSPTSDQSPKPAWGQRPRKLRVHNGDVR